MVEKDSIIKEKVFYVGLGDFKAAYLYARDWVGDNDMNLIEDSYKETVSGNSKDIEIEWNATKKVTDYFKLSLKLKWKVLGLTDVEVEIDGKKKKMNKMAEFSIDIRGVLEKDYNSKWEGTPMHKFFKDVYHKYVVPQRVDEKEDEVRSLVQGFKEEMKAYLDLTGRK